MKGLAPLVAAVFLGAAQEGPHKETPQKPTVLQGPKVEGFDVEKPERLRMIDDADVKAAEYFLALPEEQRKKEHLVFYADGCIFDFSLRDRPWSDFDRPEFVKILREKKGPMVAIHSHPLAAPLIEFPGYHSNEDNVDFCLDGFINFIASTEGYKGTPIRSRFICLGGEKPVSIAYGIETKPMAQIQQWGLAIGRTLNNFRSDFPEEALTLENLAMAFGDVPEESFRAHHFWQDIAAGYFRDFLDYCKARCPGETDLSKCPLNVLDFSHLAAQGKRDYWIVPRGKIDLGLVVKEEQK